MGEAIRISKELQEAARAEAAEEAKQNIEAARSAVPLVENVDGASSTGRERTLAQCQVLEYRLADSTLPSGGLQEAVLLSAERFLSESRLSGSRTLDVVGFSEVREEPEVAQ